MTNRRRRGPREIVQYRHRQDEPSRQAPGPGEVAGQLAHLKAHREFQRQDRSNAMRVDWCTVISRQESAEFIRRELHRKINSKCPGFLANGALTQPDGQIDLMRFRRHLQARAVIHPQDGATLPRRLRRRMAAAHHKRWDERQLDLMLHGPTGPSPAWLGAPQQIRETMETARALRHALRCQHAPRRQGREAHLGLVISCRLCGRHWTEEETGEGCPACRETMICPGDLHPWIAAVGPDGRPLGNRTAPRDHGNCPDWHPVLAATAGTFR